MATLVYIVVNSQTDCCNTVLAGAPRTVTYKLQRVLNAAARVVTSTWNGSFTTAWVRYCMTNWLDVPDRAFFKLAVTVHRYLNCCTPPYLSDYCIPAAGAATRWHLCSANCQLLAVPCYWLNAYGCQPFWLSAPVWKSLPDFIREIRPSVHTVSEVCLKRTCSLDTNAFSALEVLDDDRTLSIY